MLLKLTSLQASIKPEAVETIDEPVWELEEKNVEDGAEVQRKLKTKMAKRLVKKTKKLHDFLEEHGFSEDVNEPQKPSCFCRRECLYPIHVATKNGDAEVVRLLIDAGWAEVCWLLILSYTWFVHSDQHGSDEDPVVSVVIFTGAMA